MPRLRVPSWLGFPSSAEATPSSADADRKKQNRRSFSGLSQLLPVPNSKQETAPVAKHDAAANGSTQAPVGASRMTTLARTISQNTEKLETYMKANGLPDPSFSADYPGDFPKLPEDMQKARMEIMQASRELELLVQGPRESIRWQVWSFLDTLSLQIINSYGIPKLVPLDQPISLVELREKTSLDSINLARALRHAMTSQIFCEPTPGFIAHTAASRMLAEDVAMQGWVGMNAEDIFPAAAHIREALVKYPQATSLNQAGFNFAFGTVDKEPFFATLGKDPARAKRFGQAMTSLTGGEGYETSYFVDNYDFSEMNDREGVFVDVGGSHGFVCVDLGKKWEKMKFIVQDLPKTVDSAPNPICEDENVAKRIQFQAHDFFTEQPVKDADVYYFRWIIHNYSTPYAIKILKGLIPALKPGARIVINDHCIREAGSETPWDDRLMRSMDLVMLSLLNAQEREEAEFRELFKAADERYAFKGVTRVDGCRMSVIEAVWEPGAPDVVDEQAPAEELKKTEDDSNNTASEPTGEEKSNE